MNSCCREFLELPEPLPLLRTAYYLLLSPLKRLQFTSVAFRAKLELTEREAMTIKLIR
jgi:hypothetical protein